MLKKTPKIKYSTATHRQGWFTREWFLDKIFPALIVAASVGFFSAIVGSLFTLTTLGNTVSAHETAIQTLNPLTTEVAILKDNQNKTFESVEGIRKYLLDNNKKNLVIEEEKD